MERSPSSSGFGLAPDQKSYDVNKRYYGPTEEHFDFWLGYTHKLPWRNTRWRVQLNVRNAFEGNKLTYTTDGGSAPA